MGFSKILFTILSTLRCVFLFTGSEFTSTSLGERLYNAQRHIDSAHEESQRVQTQLQEVQAHCINVIAEHGEKEEKRQKAEEEMFAEAVPEESNIADDEEIAQDAS